MQSQDSCYPLDDVISEDDVISVQDEDEYQNLLIKALLNQRDPEIIQLLANFLQKVKKNCYSYQRPLSRSCFILRSRKMSGLGTVQL